MSLPFVSARRIPRVFSVFGSFRLEQVELMLGLLYRRYLDQPEQALKHLQAAAKKLTDPGQLKMCQDELARLQK